MTASAGACGPRFGPGAAGFEVPAELEDVLRRVRAHMSGRSKHGQWWGPPMGGPRPWAKG